MDSVKTLLASKTAWAMIVSIMAGIAAKRHIVIDGDTQSTIVDYAIQAVAWLSGATAIFRHIALKQTIVVIAAMTLILGCQPFNVTGQMAVQTNGWDFRLAPVSIVLQPMPNTPTPTTPAFTTPTPTTLPNATGATKNHTLPDLTPIAARR